MDLVVRVRNVTGFIQVKYLRLQLIVNVKLNSMAQLISEIHHNKSCEPGG